MANYTSDEISAQLNEIIGTDHATLHITQITPAVKRHSKPTVIKGLTPQENQAALFFQRGSLTIQKFCVTLHRVSPTRPAPRKPRQVLIEATVSGCSGAM